MINNVKKTWVVSTMAAGILTASAAVCVRADVVALYKLDEPAGSSGPVKDSVGSNNGAVVGSPTRGAVGQFGTAYRFTANGQGTDLNSTSTVLPTGDFTVTLWFNPSSFSNYTRLLDASDGAGASSMHGYRLLLNNAGSATPQLVAQANGENGSYISFTAGQTLTANHWYFAALRYDADGDAQFTVLQSGIANLDDSGIDNATISGASDGSISYAAGTDALLASDHANANGTFRGGLDDVAFFNSVLTDQQLKDIYSHGAASQVPEPGSLSLLVLGGLALLKRRRAS